MYIDIFKECFVLLLRMVAVYIAPYSGTPVEGSRHSLLRAHPLLMSLWSFFVYIFFVICFTIYMFMPSSFRCI